MSGLNRALISGLAGSRSVPARVLASAAPNHVLLTGAPAKFRWIPMAPAVPRVPELAPQVRVESHEALMVIVGPPGRAAPQIVAAC